MSKAKPLQGFLVFFLSVSLCSAAGAQEFQDPAAGRPLQFPEDHGAHPSYKTEWWYFTGHLKNGERTFGFELTFFRVGITPEPDSPSAWAAGSFYLSHAALTDDQEKRFYYAERASRGAFGEAGAEQGKLHVWNHSWKAVLEDGSLFVSAEDKQFSFELEFTPAKEIMPQGDNGYSRKGAGEGESSYYSSFTRLEGNGKVKIKDAPAIAVHALGWMDHEYTSKSLPPHLAGWDWFAVQLDNGEELMFYQLRSKDGSKDPFSSGMRRAADGSSTHFSADGFTLTPLGKWKSPASGITYPSGWKAEIPSLGYSLEILPTVKGQELITAETTGVTYWEGRCVVKGKNGAETVKGAAYAELTGYGEKLDYS